MLARRVGGRKRRSFLTATKPFTDTEKLFAGGATGYLSTKNNNRDLALRTMVVTRRFVAEYNCL